MLNILEKEKVFSIIEKFEVDLKTSFGVMTPQHILEHLIMSLTLSTGKKIITFNGNQAVAEKVKAALIYSEMILPQGIKNPLLKDVPGDYVFADIAEAKKALKEELNYFYDYKENNPNAKFVHPRMSELTIDEWTVMHSKHFSHHFNQVNLI
jgi:hypothetical protein